MGGKTKESYQIQKARKKLIKQMEKEKELMSDKAIDQMKRAIQIRFIRHQESRIELKDRPITQFDENSNPAKTKSKFVTEMISSLKQETDKTHSGKTLAGRINKKSS